jgi:hypothetical protein
MPVANCRAGICAALFAAGFVIACVAVSTFVAGSPIAKTATGFNREADSPSELNDCIGAPAGLYLEQVL